MWDSGSFGGGEGPPTGTEQVIHACACARELINTLRKHPGRRLMRDPFKATRDLHLYLGRGGHNVMSGFAVTCAILALALHRPIAADIAISSVGIHGSEYVPFQYISTEYSCILL